VDLTKYIEEHFFNFDYTFDETTTNENVRKFIQKMEIFKNFLIFFSYIMRLLDLWSRQLFQQG